MKSLSQSSIAFEFIQKDTNKQPQMIKNRLFNKNIEELQQNVYLLLGNDQSKWKLNKLYVDCFRDISILSLSEKFDIKYLKLLYLDDCALESIQWLSKMAMPSLQELLLRNNRINRLNSLKKINSENLKYLNLTNNYITQQSALIQANISNLGFLWLEQNSESINQCSNIKSLIKLSFSPQLRYFYLWIKSSFRINQDHLSIYFKNKYPKKTKVSFQTAELDYSVVQKV